MDEFFSQLWTAAQTAGPFGTLLGLFMWWREAGKRDKAEDEKTALMRETFESNHEIAGAVSGLNQTIIAWMNSQKLRGGR